jgi:multidrug efflux system membrane fusion protein
MMMMPNTRRFAAVTMAAAGLVAGCTKEEKYEKPLTPVRVQVVDRASGVPGVRYSASIEPFKRVDLAFKSGGYIQSLAQVNGRPIQDGDRVTHGMVLAQVKPADYEQKVKQARSMLAEAEAAATPTKQAYDRAQQLFQARSITRPELEQAQGAWDTVQAKLAGARALVQEAENAQGDTALTSPLNGIVMKKLIEVGSLVGPGVGGFVLADTSSIKVVFGAPDTMLHRLRVGTTETVTCEGVPGRTFTGRITNIAPTADPRSRVFDIEITIPNQDGALKVGMVASVQLNVPSAATEAQADAAAVAVPLTAVVRSKTKADGYAVYVLEEKGASTVARLRDVTLGDMVGNQVGVVSGIRPGEKVIISGATIVNDGEQVRVIL